MASPRFLPLPEEERTHISEALLGQIVVPERAEIVTAGMRSEVYTLRDGWAYRHVDLADGRRQVIDFVLPGETIGIASQLLGAARHSVTMLTSGVLCSFGRVDLDLLMRARPQCGEVLLRAMAAECRTLEQRVVDLGTKSAEQRLASIMIDVYERSSDNDEALPELHSCFFPITQRLLANAAGLTPTHVSNTLAQMRKLAVVELSGKVLRILDYGRLQSLAGTTGPRAPQTYLI